MKSYGFVTSILGLITITTSLTIKSIGHEKILTETIGKAFVYHREIKITIVFKTNKLYQDANIIQSLYAPVVKHYRKHSCTDTAFNILTARMKNLERSVNKLKTITHARTKQGLLNIIGSISKTLFVTL